MPAHFSKISTWLNQGGLGGTDPLPQRRGAATFSQLGSSTSTAPSKLAAQYPHQSHPSKPQHPNTSPFPATDTQLGVHIYIKSRVYCHFYLDLHNCVTASDVKRDVPSLPRELAREGGEPRLAPPNPAGWTTAPVMALPSGQSRSSQHCCMALSRCMPQRGESIPLLCAARSAGHPVTAVSHSSLASNPPAVQRWAWLAQSRAPHSLVGTARVCLYIDTATEDAQTNKTSFFFPCNPHTDVGTAMHYTATATTGAAQSQVWVRARSWVASGTNLHRSLNNGLPPTSGFARNRHPPPYSAAKAQDSACAPPTVDSH